MSSALPPGTIVELAGLQTAALNGTRGVVRARAGAAAPAPGRIAVELEGGGGTKSIPYENLIAVAGSGGGRGAVTAGGGSDGTAVGGGRDVSAAPVTPQPHPEESEMPLEATAIEYVCPICLVNADDAMGAGIPLQCYTCGQLTCGECAPKLIAQVDKCPTCRAPMMVDSWEEAVARLLRLLERTPGRHTPRAQNNLAGMYENGIGVPQDYTEAARLYKLAADLGDPIAQSNFGEMYDEGKGVKQDYVEAMKWYRLAADQGNPLGQSNVGVMYSEGTGVVQDHEEAVKWHRLAAKQGYAQAQNNLGCKYTNGAGVQQDYTEAARWYKLAAEQGNACAIESLGLVLLHHLFPPSTKVKLVNLKAANFNGKRGLVAPPKGTAGVGKVRVLVDGDKKPRPIPYENLEVV